jgi:hypothetical protein
MRACQATGETDPLPTLKLTPPNLVFSVNQREPAAPASAHSDPTLHGDEWDMVSRRAEVLGRAVPPSSSIAIGSSRPGS